MILFSLMACTEPSMKRIDALDKRVEIAERKFKDIEKEFDKLVDEYARINDLLRESNTPMQELYLFRAYLQQFEDVRDEMTAEMSYSHSQLKDLKDDIKNGIYNDNQITEYLDAEEKAIKMIEARLNYFSEHFKEQDKFVKSVQ